MVRGWMMGRCIYMPLQHIDNKCMPVLAWFHSGMGTGMYTMIQLPLSILQVTRCQAGLGDEAIVGSFTYAVETTVMM